MEVKPKLYPLKNSIYNRVSYWILEDPRVTYTFDNGATNHQQTLWFTIGQSSLTWRGRYLQHILNLMVKVAEPVIDKKRNAVCFTITKKQSDYLQSIYNSAGISWTLYRNALRDNKIIHPDTLMTYQIANELSSLEELT